MMEGLRLHHVGWAVSDLDPATEAFQRLGYAREPSLPDTVDENFGVKLRFLCRPGDNVLIELVQPTRADSTVSALIVRNGAGPYHLGFCVDDLDAAAQDLRAGQFRPTMAPARAPALGMRIIQFFHRRDTGLIELIQWPKDQPQI